MIKKILFNALILSGLLANAQTFTLNYPFSAITLTTGLIDPTPTPTAVGVTSGSFTAVGTPGGNPNASGRFSFQGWPTGSATGTVSTDIYANMTGTINTGEYYEITIAPQSGYTLTLNSIAFGVRRSGTGIRNYSVRSSIDGYANNLTASVLTNTNLSVVGTNEFFWNFDATSTSADQIGSTINLSSAIITTSVSFRFYAWNSEVGGTTGGTFSIDNVLINGSASNGTVSCASPTITAITGNSVICSNQSLNLGSSVSGDAPFTYTWTGAGSVATPNASTTSITNATSSDYTLTVSNACGTATSVVTATVNPSPSVSVNSATICSGESATLTASGATSYSWSSGASTSSIVVSPTAPSSYTVIGTDANNCSNSSISSVVVNTLPNITVNSGSICIGDSYTITASGASSYLWNTGEATASIVVTPTMSPVSYTVTGTDVNSCSSDAVATITVNSVPNTALTLNPNLQCVTVNTVTLAGGSPTGGVYSGTGVTGGVFSPSTVGVGTYTITYSYTDGNNCSAIASDIMTVSACTGIQTLNSDVVSIYPNPSNGLVVVKTAALNAQVNVFDINGKNVFSQITDSFETQINLSHLANGVYQMNIISDNQSINQKIMINK